MRTMMMIMMEDWVRLLLLTTCIVTWTPSFIHGFTDPSHTFALNEMCSSMNSPQQLPLWTPLGGDPCGDSWIGVHCSGSRVTTIKLSSLQLSGTIGYHLTSLTSLIELDLSNNSLGGSIPNQLPPNVQRLNLTNNQFTGNLPDSLSQMTSLSYLNISQNQLSGQLGNVFQNLGSLSILDLSFNTLSGPLPNSFGFLFGIESMYLQNNQFTGPIDVLADLPLENLNVANNRLTGRIPEQLKGINLQTGGNLFKMAPAPAPAPGKPFNMAPAPLPHSSKPPAKRPASPKQQSNSVFRGDSEKSWIEGGAIAGIVMLLFVVGAIVAFCLAKKRRSRTQKPKEESFNLASTAPQDKKAIQKSSSTGTEKLDIWASLNLQSPVADCHKLIADNNSKKNRAIVPSSVRAYSIADLQMATGSFSVKNLLGEGTFGRVYHAEFDDGKDFAVKKIDSLVLPPETADCFTEIVSRICQLDHPNVTKLVGYCSEHGQHLLVYEFHKKGSLHDFLHPSDDQNKPLIWNSRINIALGTARAIEYLHEVCSQSVVHKNINSTNILLDSELNPHLSDSGLASFLPTANELLNQREEGSGYRAPEVSMSSQYSLESDVYSFGVVMLELLTGRKPFDSTRRRSEQSLVRWATPQLHDIDALCKMVDPALDGLFPVRSLSQLADVIALCVQSEQEFRPPMSEVVQVLLMLVQRSNFSKRTVQRHSQDYM